MSTPEQTSTHAGSQAARAMAARAHRRGTRAAATYLVRSAWLVGAAYWVVVLAIGAVILYIELRGDDVSISAVGGPASSARFFLLVLGIILPLGMIALHVSAGGTRRSLTHGLWAGSLVTGVTFGLATTLVLWCGGWLFTRQGWTIEPERAVYGDWSQIGSVLVVESLYCTVYFLAGMIIALAYYRTGGWLGTLLIPVALVPLLVAETTLQSGYFGSPLSGALGVPEMSGWLVPLGGLAAVALAAAILQVVLRAIPVRPVEFGQSVTG
ncbi:hypothetical protein [Oerskovia flava]|uniref:hypothetical protein n=1 Tax=Oerskovia flava TaxID=2986422 RepID=UPI00223EBBDE|nr:hypothetical protein [Oerskovia sp. JB1-3-2]